MMKRHYSSNITSDDVEFFVGNEVEHTPAHEMLTFFVVGLHPFSEIQNRLNTLSEPVEHIFFGSNHSFNPQSTNDWNRWEDMIRYFLEHGYICSLDIPATIMNDFNNNCALCIYNNFIPQIRVPIANVKLWNYNTMIKLDDIDFKATNPGVWTHKLHDLQDYSKFTAWYEYKKDRIIK